MFEFGSGEILFLLVLALLLLGPQRLPEVAKTLGRMIHKFKQAGGEIQDYLDHAAEAPGSDSQPETSPPRTSQAADGSPSAPRTNEPSP